MFSENTLVKMRKACESMYDHVCDVVVSEEITDENGVTSFRDSVRYTNIPCHVSQTANRANENGGKNDLVSEISVFLSNEFDVPAGCRIIWGNREYKSSSITRIYPVYQQIMLELVGDVA